MKNIKTYEGFFDFFKKKKTIKVSFNDIMDCLYDLTDEHRIKNQLNGVRVNGIFASDNVVFKRSLVSLDDEHDAIMNDELYRNKNFKVRGNSIAFNFTYNPSEISDEEVNELLLDCKYKLEIYDCEVSFFIGWGNDEGSSSDKEWSDFMSMINKTIKRTHVPQIIQFNNEIFKLPEIPRNITVKIKSSNGFS